jgi:excisionase family DNA binding protein
MRANRPSVPLPKIERPTNTAGNTIEWVTPPVAAKLAGIGLRTIRRWIANGLLPHHRRANGRIFVSITDLENTL